MQAAETGPFWVYIQGDEMQDAWVGPYATEDAANYALDHSSLVDMLCAENATECYTTAEQPHDGQIFTPGEEDIQD